MPSIDLWATDGYINTPDGRNIYIWGFTDQEGRAAQLPGPTIIVKQQAPPAKTLVTVNLTNRLSEPVSLLFPGQTEVEADNQPVKPHYLNGSLISLTSHVLPGRTVRYTFNATSPGTFLYESGTFPHKQVQMGLYGAIIVRPYDFDPHHQEHKTAYGHGTGTEFDREYLLVMSELDPDLHQSVESGQAYEVRKYRPRYWVINGRCANDSMLDDHAAHLPNQPYGSMLMMEPGEKILIRYAGAGLENHPMHPHGNHTRLVGLDGRLLQKRSGSHTTDLSYKRFTVLTGAAQSLKARFPWGCTG